MRFVSKVEAVRSGQDTHRITIVVPASSTPQPVRTDRNDEDFDERLVAWERECEESRRGLKGLVGKAIDVEIHGLAEDADAGAGDPERPEVGDETDAEADTAAEYRDAVEKRLNDE